MYNVYIYRTTYRNWMSVLLQLYKIKKTNPRRIGIEKAYVSAIMKSDRQKKTVMITYPLATALASVSHLAKLNKNISKLTVDNGRICFLYKEHNICLEVGSGGDIDASFFKEEYNFLNVKNEIVIDIGSNLGDTALYFCCNGAKKVISLEPYPYTYNIAFENVNNSNFKGQIELINAAYGKDEIIKIDDTFIPDNGTDLKLSKNGIPLPSISLKTLLSKYSFDEAILKMDCEGCEYNILNEDIQTIQKFKMMQIEYHYGYERIYDYLIKAGFSVSYTEHIKHFGKNANNKSANKPSMILGNIYAKRD